MPSKWMKQLQKLEGATDMEYDWCAPENVMQSCSPSLNWIFPKTFGIPYGQSAILYSEPKAGKSLLCNLFIAWLHQTDPTAEVAYFNTEFRSMQLSTEWGIDPDRVASFDVSDPTKIFDRIADEILTCVKSGMPLKLIIIDSLQGMQGVKEMTKNSVADHLMGDHALTVGGGLKKILPIIREHKIALLCTAHVRANMNKGQYGSPIVMGGGWAQKHFFESFISIKRAGGAESKRDLEGNVFESDNKDMKGNKDITGHKIFIKMQENSMGAAGRTGQITIDYQKGLINTHEEIFELAKNLHLVDRPNNRTYIVGEKKYTSKLEFLNGIKNDPELQKNLLDKIYCRD